MNYKTFLRGSYRSDPLPNNVLKQSENGTYALVPFSRDGFADALASDFSISSQLKSGVSLKEVNKVQPLNRVAAADLAENIMSNIKQ